MSKKITLQQGVNLWTAWHLVVLMLVLIGSMLTVGLFCILMVFLIPLLGNTPNTLLYVISSWGTFCTLGFVMAQLYGIKYLFGYHFIDFDLDLVMHHPDQDPWTKEYQKVRAKKMRRVGLSFLWRYWAFLAAGAMVGIGLGSLSLGFVLFLGVVVHCLASFMGIMGAFRQDYKDFHLTITKAQPYSPRIETFTLLRWAEDNMYGWLLFLGRHFGGDVKKSSDYTMIRCDANGGFNYVFATSLYEEAKRQADQEAFASFQVPEAKSLWSIAFPSLYAKNSDSQLHYGEKFIKEKIFEIIHDFQGTPFEWIFDSRSTPDNLDVYLRELGLVVSRQSSIFLLEKKPPEKMDFKEWTWRLISDQEFQENQQIHDFLSQFAPSASKVYQRLKEKNVSLDGESRLIAVFYQDQLMGLAFIYFSPSIMGIHVPLLKDVSNVAPFFITALHDYAAQEKVQTLIIALEDEGEWDKASLSMREIGHFNYFLKA